MPFSAEFSTEYRRAHPRFEVSLPGALVTPEHTVTVLVVDLSAGGALVRVPITMHPSFSRTVRGLAICDFGTAPCRVVLQADRRFHIAFARPASVHSRLGRFLASLSAAEAWAPCRDRPADPGP